MRFMILHKTNAHWEGGALPTRELIARVGAMIGGLVQSGQLLAGEGLRPSSQGVRARFVSASPDRVGRGLKPVARTADTHVVTMEIGRASCRERV